MVAVGTGPRLRLTLAVDSDVWGGAESAVATLLRELPDRVSCSLLATDPVPDRLVQAAAGRAELVVVPAVMGKLDVRGLGRLAAALRRTRPDVVHVNASEPSNNRHVLALAGRRVPTVAVLHLWSPVPTSGLQARVLRAGYRSAAAVVVVSQALREHVVGQLGIAQNAVQVVANGVEPLPRVALRDPASPLRVGALARLVEHKGLDVAVEAVRLLAAQPGASPVELVVAGDGPQRARLERAAQGLPVRLVGPVPDGAAFLLGLDAFVLPSRDEGLPLALLEAMSAGLPCLVTDVGDVVAAVGPGALVVAPDDAAAIADGLRRLAGDPELRRRLGGLAYERAHERYTAQAMTASMLAVYDRVARP